MAISFIRVDDRIIHGQIVTRWMSERACDGVIAVDTPSAENQVLSKVLKSAVPSPLKAFVLTEDEIVLKWDKIVNSKKKYFLIAKTPETLLRIYDRGVDFMSELNELNIGPMSSRDNAKHYEKNLCITPEEEKAFNGLEEKGMHVFYQLVPDSKKKTWKELKIGGE